MGLSDETSSVGADANGCCSPRYFGFARDPFKGMKGADCSAMSLARIASMRIRLLALDQVVAQRGEPPKRELWQEKLMVVGKKIQITEASKLTTRDVTRM